MSTARNFGVQSYCFRNFKDNHDVAAKVKEIGVSSIEVCAAHADFNDTASHADVIGAYKDAGVDIVSIGVQTFTGDEAHERKWCEFAKAAGAKHISAHFNVDSFQTAVPLAAKLAEEYDLRIAIHCHGGYRFNGSVDVLKHLLDIGGERIGINIDTAWCMQIGPRQGNPVKWVETFAGRIYGVHFKDFVFERNAAWKDVVVGTGNLDLPAFVNALEASNFDGFAVIEYEADPENPVPALTECVQQMKAAT